MKSIRACRVMILEPQEDTSVHGQWADMRDVCEAAAWCMLSVWLVTDLQKHLWRNGKALHRLFYVQRGKTLQCAVVFTAIFKRRIPPPSQANLNLPKPSPAKPILPPSTPWLLVCVSNISANIMPHIQDSRCSEMLCNCSPTCSSPLSHPHSVAKVRVLREPIYIDTLALSGPSNNGK